MPTYYARKAGNINATDVWATTPSGTAGAQTFAAGDVLVANSFAITVNVSTNLGNGTVTNDNRDGATAGGSFALSDGVTLTANCVAGGTGNCVTTSGAVSASIVGSLTGGTGTSANCVFHNSTGSLTITGNITGGSASNAWGLNIQNSGTVAVTGNCTGGPNPSGRAVQYASSGTLTVTGTVSGGSSGPGLEATGSGTVSIVGICAGAAALGMTISGGSATVTATRARGGPNIGSAVGVAGPTSGSASVTIDEIEYGDLGASPTSGSIRLSGKPTNVAIMYRFGTTKKTLVDANASGLMPTASNVRSGVVYNGGNSTGTMAVPAAGSVALGVPVDNTTGTAILTQANVETALGAFSGGRLANCATVASTGQQIADAVTA